MTVKLFQQLRLPPRQQQLAAAAAEYWQHRRRGLDIDLRLALGPLSCLPSLPSLPRTDILNLCGLDLPELDPNADLPDTADNPNPTAPLLPQDLQPSSASRDTGTAAAGLGAGGEAGEQLRQPGAGRRWDTADLDEEVEHGVCLLCNRYGCSVCECRLCSCVCTCGHATVAWQRRLLGCDPAASAAARAAVRRLRAFQQVDSDLFADMQRAVRMPGCIFTAEQMVGGLPTALQHAVPFVDWLRVCQTAAGEARVERLRADGKAMGWAVE